MLTVHCFHVLSGWVKVLVPLRYRALVSQYAQFGEDVTGPLASELRRLSGMGWCSRTEYRTWLQLPGVVVER